MPPQRAPKKRRPETAIQNSASALRNPAPAIPKSAFAILNAQTASPIPRCAVSEINPRVARFSLGDSEFSAAVSNPGICDSRQTVSGLLNRDLR